MKRYPASRDPQTLLESAQYGPPVAKQFVLAAELQSAEER